MADRFEELRIFVAVVDAGGVNAAAARLDLAKSAVSRRISKLEERLGVDLLARETRRFTLTAAGLAHHARAKALLADLDAMDRSATAGERPRPLTVSAPLELAIHVVAPALAALGARSPDSAFRLTADDAQADVTIAITSAGGRRKVADEVGRTIVLRYAAPRSDGDDAAARARSIEVSTPPNWLAAAGSADAASLVVGTLDMALAAAIAGAGAATLPGFMTADAVADGRLAVLRDEATGHHLVITATVAAGVDASGLLEQITARLHGA